MSKILHFQFHHPTFSTSKPFSFSQTLTTTSTPLTHLTFHLQNLSLSLSKPTPSTLIRMGGGPRTYPGGVSKWQWKRMQAKKAKQLLKARLARERQIYEMRKRAELKAAVAELERPWKPVEKPPRLFSVAADEQLKVLADRFQKPGGFDLWTDKDGPQVYNTGDDLPSTRFFPKGVVHSVKPYGIISDGRNEFEGEVEDTGSESDTFTELGKRNGGNVDKRRGNGRRVGKGGLDGGLSDSGVESGSGTRMALGRRNGGYEGRKKGYGRRRVREKIVDGELSGSGSESDLNPSSLMRDNNGKRSVGVGIMSKGNRRIGSDVEEQSQAVFDRKMRGVENGPIRSWANGRVGRNDRRRKMYDSDSQVYEMNLQEDGSYEL